MRKAAECWGSVPAGRKLGCLLYRNRRAFVSLNENATALIVADPTLSKVAAKAAVCYRCRTLLVNHFVKRLRNRTTKNPKQKK
jgi:hypothetical protein